MTDVKPTTEEQMKALASDQKFILLFKLLGCKRIEDDPSSFPAPPVMIPRDENV